MGYYTSSLAWILWVGIAVGLAFIPATIARNKGYSYGGFWVFGFFLFLIALIVALCISDKNAQNYPPPYQQPYQQPYQPPYQQPAQAACPSCGSSVAADTAFCPKCGAKLK